MWNLSNLPNPKSNPKSKIQKSHDLINFSSFDLCLTKIIYINYGSKEIQKTILAFRCQVVNKKINFCMEKCDSFS